jgi:hypothetical protein
MRWAGYVARMGEINVYILEVGKPGCRWEYNLGIRKFGYIVWTGFTQLRVGTSGGL